jgi:hypothetical protein
LDAGLRDALVRAHLPTDFRPPVSCDQPLVELGLIETTAPAARLGVVLANYTGTPLDSVTVTLDGVAATTRVRSIRHGELKTTTV